MDNLKNFRRTNYCGDLRLGDTGKTVSLCGWVQRQRDLGGLIFGAITTYALMRCAEYRARIGRLRRPPQP